jgi:hypothetical protein
LVHLKWESLLRIVNGTADHLNADVFSFL